jgi:pimeloyl-ACP methyl ester carboxylesterase
MDVLNSKIIKLKDNRKLSYAEYGDSQGKPLFYFHGWPVSRLGGVIYDEAAQELGIRVISPDRPGIGFSDFKENRSLLDYPDDILELADQLGIDKFAVLGQSGGGPYAASVAYKIPQRLNKVGILVGLGPTYVPGLLDGMSWFYKFGWENYSKIPFIAEIAVLQHFFIAKFSLDFLSNFAFGSKEDKRVLSNYKYRSKLLESRKEVFRQGIKGASLELKLYTTKWNFDLSKIKSKVYLFYGEDDRNVPLAMGKYYHSQIPGSILKTYLGEGHLISLTHSKEILETLM